MFKKNATRCMYRCCVKNETEDFVSSSEALIFWRFVYLFFPQNDTHSNAMDADKKKWFRFFE